MEQGTINRREWILRGLQYSASLALAASASGREWAQGSLNGEVSAAASLKAHAAARGLLTGCAVDMNLLQTDALYRRILAEQSSILVGENCMKFGAMQPRQGVYQFAAADALLDFAASHEIKVRGHNFVWHEALPPWFAGAVTHKNAQEVLTEHIQSVGGRYKGRIHSWDVVNEAIWIKDGRSDGLRSSSPWFQLLGPEYLEIAFRAARQADPTALLTYNDYGIEDDGPENTAKREAVIGLLRRLKAANVPLDALGVQSHLRAGRSAGFAKGLAALSKAAQELGLQLFITEMDVNDDSVAADDSAGRDRAVAETYRAYLAEALQAPEWKAVLAWGLSDDHTWLNHGTEARKQHPARQERPLPFGTGYEPKPAFFAVRDAFDDAPSR